MDERSEIPVARIVPEEFDEEYKRWSSKAKRWRRWEFILGFLSLLLSLLLATFSDDLAKPKFSVFDTGVSYLKALTFLNALAIGLIGAFNMSDGATSVRQAGRKFQAAIYSYKWDPAFTIQDLIKAFTEAQAVMGHARLSLPSKKP